MSILSQYTIGQELYVIYIFMLNTYLWHMNDAMIYHRDYYLCKRLVARAVQKNEIPD